jgi:hypothetical protein
MTHAKKPWISPYPPLPKPAIHSQNACATSSLPGSPPVSTGWSCAGPGRSPPAAKRPPASRSRRGLPPHRVCQCSRGAAGAPRRGRPGTERQNRAEDCALPVASQAQAVPAPPGKKNGAAAVFVKQGTKRLGPIATVARQPPQQPVRLCWQAASRVGLQRPPVDG